MPLTGKDWVELMLFRNMSVSGVCMCWRKARWCVLDVTVDVIMVL